LLQLCIVPCAVSILEFMRRASDTPNHRVGQSLQGGQLMPGDNYRRPGARQLAECCGDHINVTGIDTPKGLIGNQASGPSRQCYSDFSAPQLTTGKAPWSV